MSLIAARVEPEFAVQLIKNLLNKKDPRDRTKHLFLAAKCFADVRNKTLLQDVSCVLETRLKGIVRRRSLETKRNLWGESDWAEFSYTSRAWIRSSTDADAVTAVAMCWPKSQSTREWLLSLLNEPSSTDACVSAVHEVALGWRTDDGTILWLKKLAQSHRSGIVREVAVQELARGWKDLEETVLWLLDRGQHDDDLRVREIAARELVIGWKEDSRLLPWLRNRVRFYQGANLAYQAVRAVARTSKDDPTAFRWLMKVAQSEEDWVLRSYAAWSGVWAGDRVGPTRRRSALRDAYPVEERDPTQLRFRS